jgi:uncharacterized protein YecE (DUF72 family)
MHVGTSGWTYDDWTGPFYPDEVKGAERLVFYAAQFDTVEVNATFYRLPFAGMITGWNRRLPPSFHLVLKGPRLVTHHKRLRDCLEPLDRFLERVRELHTLKVLLWQLPPSLQRDLELLDRFLGQLPSYVRHAVEFRHLSWWDDETVRLLARHETAFVAVSHPKLPDDILPTTDFLYLRFHGLGEQLYRYDYSRDELAEWARRVKPHRRGRELYAFFNNDFEAHAPFNAKTFRQLAARR